MNNACHEFRAGFVGTPERATGGVPVLSQGLDLYHPVPGRSPMSGNTG